MNEGIKTKLATIKCLADVECNNNDVLKQTINSCVTSICIILLDELQSHQEPSVSLTLPQQRFS